MDKRGCYISGVWVDRSVTLPDSSQRFEEFPEYCIPIIYDGQGLLMIVDCMWLLVTDDYLIKEVIEYFLDLIVYDLYLESFFNGDCLALTNNRDMFVIDWDFLWLLMCENYIYYM